MPAAVMEIEHVNIKIFAKEPVEADLAGAIPMFHRWIQESVTPELLVDVADYRHVPSGPGVLLVGHEANYSLDLGGNRLGLLYNRKTAFPGDAVEKFKQAYDAAVQACALIEVDPAFQGKLKFDLKHFELIVNDRLLAPNTGETWEALKPEIEKFCQSQLGDAFGLRHEGGPRERFRVEIEADAPVNAQ
ncbi:MAG TPA: hypothetical protein VFQ79_03525 [Bryobacteraceae bacterium]|nr:hypothetical protein [Bryobacteraceae bacterium]